MSAILAALLLAAFAPLAFAQGVEVTASLNETNGLARPGAYVPVRFTITNKTADVIAEIRINSGGPIEVVLPCNVTPNETDEETVPVFYVGGNLTLKLDFRSAYNIPVAQSTLTVKNLRAPAVDEKAGGNNLPDYSLGFPKGIDAPVQPRVAQLFGANAWPQADRRRLWLWLGLLTLAVLAAGAIVPRRSNVLAVSLLVGIAIVVTISLFVWGDVLLARGREARVFYRSISETAPSTSEDFTELMSRGGRNARRFIASLTGWHFYPPSATWGLPLPVLTDSQELFQTQAVLHYGQLPVAKDAFFVVPPYLPNVPPISALRDMEMQRFMESASESTLWFMSERYAVTISSHRARFIYHVLENGWPPFKADVKTITLPEVHAVAARPDCIKSLLINGVQATDAAGRMQTVDAWAVEWKNAADPDVAFVGRSLAWWAHDRQEGDGPYLLAWFHDPPTARMEGDTSTPVERLPALVVFSAAQP